MTTIHFEALDDPTSQAPLVARLAARAARTDARAWEALVERYGRMVLSIARSYGLSDADVCDVSQTVWMRLLEHAARLRHPERVGGWLATTTRNECLRVIRHHKRTAPVDFLDLDLVDDGADRLPAVEMEDRDCHLRSALAALPDQQRDLLQLLMSDPRPSYVEVATNLGIPIGSIGPTRQRSLRALRAKCVAAHI